MTGEALDELSHGMEIICVSVEGEEVADEKIGTATERSLELLSFLPDFILHDAVEFADRTTLLCFCSNVQTFLISLSDKLFLSLSRRKGKWQDLNSENTGFENESIRIMQEMEKVLVWLRGHYSDEYLFSGVVSRFAQEELRFALSDTLEAVDLKTDDELLRPVLRNVLDGAFSNRISFSKYVYLSSCHQAIANWTSVQETLPFPDLLVGLNLNDARLFLQCTRRWKESWLRQEDGEPILYLRQKRKNIRQIPTLVKGGLHPEIPSLKEQLTLWLDEEIQLQPPNPLTPPAEMPDEKIQLSFSVAVLGFLLRLLMAAKIIVNRNQSQVIRFFATHCRTSRSDDISVDSLYNKYHSPGLGARNITRDLLNQLIRTIANID